MSSPEMSLSVSFDEDTPPRPIQAVSFSTPPYMQAGPSSRPTSPSLELPVLRSGSPPLRLKPKMVPRKGQLEHEVIYGMDDVIPQRHETIDTIFDKHRRELEMLLLCPTKALQKYIAMNFGKHVWLNHLSDKLTEIVETFATEDQKQAVLRHDWNIDTMLRVVRALLEDCQKNRALMDLSFGFPETAEGLATAIERSRKRTREVISELQTTIRHQQEDINLMKDEFLLIDELKAELQAAKNHILYNEQVAAGQKMSPKEEFMRDLQYQLHMHENLNSSLHEQLEQERLSKEEILDKYLQSEAKRVQSQNKQLVEIADAVKHLEMHDIFRDAVIARIQSLTPNPAEVEKAVNEWLIIINESIKKKSDEVYKLIQEEQTFTHLKAYHEQNLADTEQIRKNLQEKEILLKEATEKYAKKEVEYKAIRSRLDDLIAITDAASEEIEKREAELKMMYGDEEGLREELRDECPTWLPRFGGQQPILKRAQGYSKMIQNQLAKDKYWQQLRSKRTVQDAAFGKVSSYLATPGHYKKLMDRSLQVVHGIPEDSPFFQNVPPNTPPHLQSFPSGIPSVEITPPSPTEPVGEYMRTRKSASSFQKTTPFTQTVFLTSPKREEPLLVNIGVDPKPLTDTESGEVFTCDISLDIHPAGHGTLPQLPGTTSEAASPPDTYHLNVPPELPATSTSGRRYRRRARTDAHFSPDSESMPYY